MPRQLPDITESSFTTMLRAFGTFTNGIYRVIYDFQEIFSSYSHLVCMCVRWNFKAGANIITFKAVAMLCISIFLYNSRYYIIKIIYTTHNFRANLYSNRFYRQWKTFAAAVQLVPWCIWGIFFTSFNDMKVIPFVTCWLILYSTPDMCSFFACMSAKSGRRTCVSFLLEIFSGEFRKDDHTWEGLARRDILLFDGYIRWERLYVFGGQWIQL